MLLWKEKLSFHIVVDTKLLFCFFLLKDTKKNLLGFNMKSLKTLVLEKLTTKCQKYRYEESIHFDLMEKYQEGELLQSCDKNSLFICDCQTQYEYFRYKQLKNRLITLSHHCYIFAKLQKKQLSSFWLFRLELFFWKKNFLWMLFLW